MNPEEPVFRAIEQLQVLSHLFLKKRAELAGRVGLTEAQWRVMEEVQNSNFMPSMFAARNEYSKAAVSKILRQLLALGLVSSSKTDEDGRFRQFEITLEGQHRMSKLNQLRENAVNLIWRSIDPGLLDASIAFNDLLIENLKNYRG